ncbi:MAG TPA: aminopeptidase P family protein [Chloroflexota bacterium]|nr:aminopeptidase P family protein [Chloroflexota bacterium]
MSAYASRIERLRALFDEAKIDGFLISQPESRFYLSGYTGHDLPPRDSAGYLMIGKGGALLLTDPRTSEQAENEANEYKTIVYSANARVGQRLVESVQELGITQLGFESIHLPYSIWESFSEALGEKGYEAADGTKVPGPGVAMVPVKDLVDKLRITKDTAEMADLQAAIDVLDDCFMHLAKHELRVGRTEKEIALAVEQYLQSRGATTSFPSIVASGPNSSMPHAVPTDRQLQEGEPITIDIGAMVNGYCSDMTRTVCIGTPSEKLREIHALVLQAQVTAEQNIKHGMTGKDADALARDYLAEMGYGESFTHGLGHGIGLEVHEPPSLSIRGSETKLEAGMVFSVEPGIYLPGWGGVRIEDLVVMEGESVRVLCRSPKALELEEVAR